MKFTTKLIIGTIIIIGLMGAAIYAMTDDTTQTKEAGIDEIKAERIALRELNGGIVTKIHMEESPDGSKEYEVTIVKKDQTFEVDIDTLTGKVSEISQYELKKNKPQNISTNISIEEAKKIALDQVNGRGTVTEINLDTFHNRLVYDVEIGTIYRREAEVFVDAANGKVLKFKEVD
ncbi:PepSY domain-containing protein [Bacillus sp. B190/17]|uniref:PepSY domain-containing protein n=1 Tax=Bacillus lumedeiriae TaxID=3058829 RepID=A0ABW8I7Q9_9BACI